MTVCKRFKDQVLLLETPLRGVGPMLTAVRKLRTSSEHLTTLHPEFLLLCVLSKMYKIGMSILEDDIFEVDQPRDLFLYCYYGCASEFFIQIYYFRSFWHLHDGEYLIFSGSFKYGSFV